MARILAVDDSTSLRQLVVHTLREAGHQVSEAVNGVEALAIARSQPFDVVISDVNMPQMDGLTLLKHLRALPSFRTIPILVLTTEMDPARKAEAKASGATGWMVKPFNPEQLLSTIRKVTG